jgi:GTP-binding protein HflX
MLETTETLLPYPQSGTSAAGKKLNVICVGVDKNSLDELDRLLTTLGVVPVGRVIVTVRKISPATYIGEGKVQEVKQLMIDKGAEAVIFDVELSPNQLRNLEIEIQKAVLDRPGVIIEIFSQHARTKEAKASIHFASPQSFLDSL